jgi:hypothetical protein
MIASRFDKTLYLDVDLFVIADIRDVFEVLDRFDMAMAHDPISNGVRCHTFWCKVLPNAFPQFNGGVVAFRHSPKVEDLLKNWSAAVRENNFNRDQPVLRELVWNSELRITTLPPEYNLMRFKDLHLWRTHHSAPRIIHSPQFHKHFTKRKTRVSTIEDLLGPMLTSRLTALLLADRSLARMAGREPHFPSGSDFFIRRLRLIKDVPLFWIRRFFRK